MYLMYCFSWFKHFIELQGTSVLAQALNHISRKALQRFATIITTMHIYLGLSMQTARGYRR